MFFDTKKFTLRTFEPGMENFAILLKGKSIEKISSIYKNYHDCFLVNNFDPEINHIGEYLINKRTVHFVNRLMTAPLKKNNYNKLNIREVQLCKKSAFRDNPLQEAISYYKKNELRTVFLPPILLKYSKTLFGSAYKNKFPNTGLIAILYALEILKPRHLWIAGLDFYQKDYLVRRPHQASIENQQEKMNRINAVEVFEKWIRDYPKTKFHVATYYEGLRPHNNLEIL